jgi:nitrate reductase NapD
MNISGVIVRARPEHAPAVRRRLVKLPGVEVHGAGEDGRMVVTIERDDDGATADTFTRLSRLDGVLSASMVYHHIVTNPDEEI